MGESETIMVETSLVHNDSSGTGASDDCGPIVPAMKNTASLTPAPDVPTVNTNLIISSVDATQVAGYDSSLNVNGVGEAGDGATAGITENGVALADGIGSAALHQPLYSSAGLSAEEERLWSIATTNSLDFDAWTALIEETERISEADILKIRKVYDTFLAEFPLCYGYWKKYADHEACLSSIEKVADIYERAVQGVTYSVDMWLHYCVFAIGTYGDPETIRGLFERALACVGTDYLCFPLWDKFIEYEILQHDWPRVATIYTTVLEIPNQQLDRYFEGFKELVARQPLSELRTAEESAASAVADSAAVGQENEGDDPYSASKTVNASLKEADELEKYISIREEIYKKAKDFDSKIVGFEAAIRRPYFHVRPLNVAELENWHKYLDFIEVEADFNKVVKIYERCLIACARYPEFWIRYVLRMEASGSMERVENALGRATQVFVKRQPEIHLFAARFKEQHGDISGARAAYQLVHTGISPGLLEAVIKHTNMEQRLGNLEDGCSLYEQAIAIEKGKEQSQTLPLLFAQYSRFVFLVSGNVEKAREILVQGVESAQLSKSLLEFLDLFGDTQSIKRADNRHAKLFLNYKSTSESKKRNAEDYLASDRSKNAKLLIPSSVSSEIGAYPSTQNQWGAGYGVQPQAWPQASQIQAQAQQWNAGYDQQAAYGSYGTGYPQPQVPTSAPPTAAYATYPETYQAQAFPQLQVYAQPAMAATMAPALQSAAAPSSNYYPSYY